MTNRAMMRRLSWLFAAVFAVGLAACASEDDGGSTGDAQLDRGQADTARPDASVDTTTPDTSPDVTQPDVPPLDTSVGEVDANGGICPPAGSNIGSVCSEEDPTFCGEGGLCATFEEGGQTTCYQACAQGPCEDVCTGNSVCYGVTFGDCSGGAACPAAELTCVDGDCVFELAAGVYLGVCDEPATGDQGAYEECGETAGACQSGMDCLVLVDEMENPIAGAACYPQCSATGPACPEGGSDLGAQCALSGGGDPTHCVLVCTPGTGTCPAGMTCEPSGGEGICIFPPT